MRELKILTIEDDKIQSNLLNIYLSKYFSNIISLENSLDAIKLINEKDFDLIITDLEMPEFSGDDVIKHARLRNYKIPIIVLSSHVEKEYLLSVANLNIQAYIQKPITQGKTLEIVKKIQAYYDNYFKNEEKNLDKIPISEDIFYDIENYEIYNKSKKHSLSCKEKMLLELLLKNKNNVVSYEEIEIKVWQSDDKNMTTDALKNIIKSLRKKISKESIKNVSGLGYKIVIKNI